MKIIKTFESFGQYKTGDVFDNIEEKKLCWKLNGFKSWLVRDLGLRSVIDDLLKDVRTYNDYTDKYQPVLKVLHDTGKYDNIIKVGGKYTNRGLHNKGLVFDENGEYDYVNKLNTNYSDLAELLTSAIIKAGKLDNVKDLSSVELKDYLMRRKSNVKGLIDGVMTTNDIRSFVRNTKNNTKRGDDAEDYACEVMMKFGMKKIYQGGNGDFIDMIFGVDLIMKHKERVITCQVKSYESLAKRSITNPYYKRIDYFISPINGIGSGIIIFNQQGRSFKISDSGNILKEGK